MSAANHDLLPGPGGTGHIGHTDHGCKFTDQPNGWRCDGWSKSQKMCLPTIKPRNMPNGHNVYGSTLKKSNSSQPALRNVGDYWESRWNIMRALRLFPRPKGSGSAVHPVGCVTTTFPANHHGCFPECTDPSKPGAPKMQSQKTLSLIWPPDFIWLVLSRFFNYFPFSHIFSSKTAAFSWFFTTSRHQPLRDPLFFTPRVAQKSATSSTVPRQRSTTARHGAALRPAPRQRHGAPRAEDAQQPPAGDR